MQPQKNFAIIDIVNILQINIIIIMNDHYIALPADFYIIFESSIRGTSIGEISVYL